jgi:hypothetical protein
MSVISCTLVVHDFLRIGHIVQTIPYLVLFEKTKLKQVFTILRRNWLLLWPLIRYS